MKSFKFNSINIPADRIVCNYKTLQIAITPSEIQARYLDINGSPNLVIENKGIRIQSTLPVSVYAHSEDTVNVTEIVYCNCTSGHKLK